LDQSAMQDRNDDPSFAEADEEDKDEEENKY
jgi:hypothetical protein